jgi:hypothetical protein
MRAIEYNIQMLNINDRKKSINHNFENINEINIFIILDHFCSIFIFQEKNQLDD